MKKELKKLRELLDEKNFDIFITADTDNHLSEFTSPHYRCMEYISGFTGGDGMLLVCKKESYLWTDGRYFVQAEKELEDSGIELMKIGEPGYPEITDWIASNLPDGGTLAFDGKCVSAVFAEKIIRKLRQSSKAYVIDSDAAIIDEMWSNRPDEVFKSCVIMPEKYTGSSVKTKICNLKKAMRKYGAQSHIMTSPDDIAWFLNMRGGDVPNTPVFSSFLLIDTSQEMDITKQNNERNLSVLDKISEYNAASENNVVCEKDASSDNNSSNEKKSQVISDAITDECRVSDCSGNPRSLIKLYISEEHLSEDIKTYLINEGIEICTDTDKVYSDVREIRADAIIIEKDIASYQLVKSIPEKTEIIDMVSPCAILKSRKNEIEMENLRKVQIKDSVAVTKFMHYFKKNLPQGELTEKNAAEKLLKIRMEREGFIGESFPAISAYSGNASMCHYNTEEAKEDVRILPYGLYLIDSGGQYLEGTTDVTRTWACGYISEMERTMYTITAMANLRLADAVFPEGTSALTLDYAARELFWQERLNYNHGTGHGVGSCLSVHERPYSIRYRAVGNEKFTAMYPGVYVSDEPGFYQENDFGIRLENMLLVVKDKITGYGQFLKFETLTYVPFDRECMDPGIMTERDKVLYNEYHEKVYELISEHLNPEEREWLKEACSPL